MSSAGGFLAPRARKLPYTREAAIHCNCGTAELNVSPGSAPRLVIVYRGAARTVETITRKLDRAVRVIPASVLEWS